MNRFFCWCLGITGISWGVVRLIDWDQARQEAYREARRQEREAARV